MADDVRTAITGLILAGGRGSRMDGADKGWVTYEGRPLVASVMERFGPQVGQILISANRNLDAYHALGHEVISDHDPASFMGPLAGIRAGLAHCKTPWLAVVPCDAPRLAGDLVARLHAEAVATGASAVHAATALRPHPLFLICRCDLLSPLDAYLGKGNRKVRDWLHSVGAASLLFESEATFANLNTPADLEAD